MAKTGPNGAAGVKTQTHSRTELPPLFRVLMHNDDYTSMDFVVQVLEQIFRKSPTEANRIMLSVHVRGIGECGVYPYEIAETKVMQVHSLARDEGYPLRCSFEQV